jgi:NADPH:quinone reductase-like Zn-dependent oxidoreductase
MLAAARRKDVVSSGGEDDAFNASKYRRLMEMAATGQVRAVIDRSFPLERIVDAHRLVDTGHKRGSVVITVGAAA